MISADEPRKFMSEIYIEYPPKMDLWAPISTKEITHVIHMKRY